MSLESQGLHIAMLLFCWKTMKQDASTYQTSKVSYSSQSPYSDTEQKNHTQFPILDQHFVCPVNVKDKEEEKVQQFQVHCVKTYTKFYFFYRVLF